MGGRIFGHFTSWCALTTGRQNLCVAGILYLSWALAMILTGLPFPVDERISNERAIGNALDLAASAGFVATMALLRAFSSRTMPLNSARFAWGMLAANALGIACCGLAAVFPYMEAVLTEESARFAWVGLEGIVLGASLAFALLALSPLVFLADRKSFLALCALELAGAVLVLFAVSWLVRPSLQAYAWIIVLASSCAAYRRGLSKKSPELKLPIEGFAHSTPVQAPLPHAPWPRKRVVAFAIANAFFLGFVIGNFPVVFHLPVFASAFKYRGMASGVVIGLCDLWTLLTLLLTIVFLGALGSCLREKEFRIAPFALAILVLVAVACATVPLYNPTTPPIPALIPLAVAGTILGLQLWCAEIARTKNAAERYRRGLGAMVACGSGYFMAAVLSFAHIVFPVEGSDPRQILIFGLLIALIVADVYLCITLHVAFRQTFFPESPFEAPLDDSSMQGRCRLAAKTYGLTRRETEVLELLAEGHGGPYIQDRLSISRNTFKTHVSHIYRKMGVTSKENLLNLLRA